jgi:DNA invertase Pin-like site-specific DNA recombinase
MTITTLAKRAGLYCRVSSPGQADNGSLEEQEQRARLWCDEHGYDVVRVCHEVYPGEDIDRPELDVLMADVKAGHIDVIVVDKVDRFSRADPAIAAYVMVEAQQYGVDVEFCEIEDDSFENQILRAVLSIVARVEVKRIKERVSAGKRRRVLGDPAKNRPSRLLPGNIPKYGWEYKDADKAAYVIDPHQAAIMERIYRELGEQHRSLNAICRDLEAEGEPPPTQALIAKGYDVGKRTGSMYWHPATIARLLKESSYWGEAIAYRYESFAATKRDPKTLKLRKRKHTRYRDPESEVIVRYPPEVWPGIVSKETAMKAIAVLTQNKIESTRRLKNSETSFLRAGLAICGYCGGNMILLAHQWGHRKEIVVRFVCGHHRAKLMRRPGATPCAAVTQYSLRVSVVEEAVWAFIVDALRDPDRMPETYERLTAREEEVRAYQTERIERLTKLIRDATVRRNDFMRAVGLTADQEMKVGYMRLAEEENAKVRTWQLELDVAKEALQAKLAETKLVRSAISRVNSQTVKLLKMNTKERRQIAQTLGVRVICFRDTHDPYFVLVSDLPGLAMAWHAKRHRRMPVEPIRYNEDEANALFATWPEGDQSHVVIRHAIHKWTATPSAKKDETRKRKPETVAPEPATSAL